MICKTPTLTLTLACQLSGCLAMDASWLIRHTGNLGLNFAAVVPRSFLILNVKGFLSDASLDECDEEQSSASQVVSRGPCERIRPRSMQFYSSGWAFVSGPRFELLDGPRLMRAKIAASMSTPYTHQQGWASSSASPLIFLQKKILLSSDTIHSKYQHGTNENLITRQFFF